MKEKGTDTSWRDMVVHASKVKEETNVADGRRNTTRIGVRTEARSDFHSYSR